MFVQCAHILPAQRYAAVVHAATMFMSVCHTQMFCPNGCTDQDGFSTDASAPIFHTAYCQKILIFSKYSTFLWNLVPSSKLRKILPRHVDRRKCCPLHLTGERPPFCATL